MKKFNQDFTYKLYIVSLLSSRLFTDNFKFMIKILAF